MENPIKMDDLGVPLFLETPISYPSSLSLNNPRSKNAGYFLQKKRGKGVFWPPQIPKDKVRIEEFCLKLAKLKS